MSSLVESGFRQDSLDWEFSPDQAAQIDKLLSWGKNEQEEQGGSLLFLDDARFFEDGKPSEDLQATIDQLRGHGVEVVILTSNNPDNLETTELRDQMTSANGLGSYGDGTLAPRAIVCIYNNHTNDQQREVVCVTGNALDTVIGKADTSRAVDQIIEGILKGDIDAGFENAYNRFDQILDARDAKATEQASQPTAVATYSTTPLEVQPSLPEEPFIERYGNEILAGASVTILTALLGVDFLFARPKRIFVKDIENSRRSAISEYKKLDARAGTGLSIFNSIANAYSESYPEEADATRQERQSFSEQLAEVKIAYDNLVAARVGFFQKKTEMAEVKLSAARLRSEAIKLARLIEDKKDQYDSLVQKEKAAQTNADAAKNKLNEVKDDWYESKLEVFGSILPPKDKALAGIKAKLDEAFNNAYYNVALALRGSNQAVEVMKLLEQFMLCVGAFTHGYEVSLALHKDAELDLKAWPDRAIDLNQLANSGVILLDQAKAGISIPEKMNEVIALSKKAEEEFASAKDFASASATVFKQVDENNQQIAEIETKGFLDKHLQGFRDEMAEALSRANAAATQGNWHEAQAQLGILRVKTNESLAEMKRLEQVYKQNLIDLENLANEVAKDKQRYSTETTPAWNDLQENFVPANYNEKDQIWQELRSNTGSSVKIVIADLNPHHAAIATTLKELTDEAENPNDIASQARSRNSFAEQRFDEAADLIRSMEERLAESRTMMDELLERQKLANQSKAEYQTAIVNSESRFKLAKESIDTKEEDRLVDSVVDQKIAQAEKFIDLAKRAGEASVYVAALEAANRATDLSIRARQSAEEQIQFLQELYRELSVHKQKSSANAEQVMKGIDNEADAVITAETKALKKTLVQALAAVVTLESGLAAKEDHDLAQAINELLEKFDRIDRNTNELSMSFLGDKSSYQRLLDDLEKAINNAETAISRASAKCNDSDAGTAGDGALSSARSTKPGMLSWGEARSTIQSKIQASKSAEDYADQAYSQASRAIAAAETARALEAQRQRQIELDRQAAINRSNEASRSISIGSNQAGRKF